MEAALQGGRDCPVNPVDLFNDAGHITAVCGRESGESTLLTEKTDAGSIILLVDDRNETSALMKELLEEGRYRVLTAADEADATVRVRVERPNLILLNLHRPPLDAIEAGCRVREGLIDGQAVPVVVIPTETLEVKGHNIDLGRNVYVSFLSAFKQLEILLRRLLQEEKTRGGLI